MTINELLDFCEKRQDEAQETLDELVYEAISWITTSRLNELNDEMLERIETEIGKGETKASKINNRGFKSQIKYLLYKGMTLVEIKTKIESNS